MSMRGDSDFNVSDREYSVVVPHALSGVNTISNDIGMNVPTSFDYRGGHEEFQFSQVLGNTRLNSHHL